MSYPNSSTDSTSYSFLARKFVVLLIMFLTACNPVISTAIATPTIGVTATILPSSTPTLKSQPICPSSNTPSIPSIPSIPSQINILWVKQAINIYLNQGGNPEKLAHELTTPKYGNLKVKMDKVDINSDNVNELIFSSGVFFTTVSDSGGVDSGLWVFECENGKYKIPYQIELFGDYRGNPRLVTAEDLNNDNRKEIVIRSTWQGSGCLQYFNIIGWERENPYHPIYRLNDKNFPCDTEFAVGNKDNNGNNEILFTGKSDIRYDAIAHIQRDFIDIYNLDNQVYILKSHEYLPSPYRIYAIYDAQQFLNKDDIDQAIQLYDQAAHDKTLQDVNSIAFSSNWHIEKKWPEDLPKQDHPKEYVSAFSLFRLTVLYFEVHEESKAMSTLKELEINYPDGKFGAEFTKAAQLYIEQRKDANKPFESCQAVSSMIENKFPHLYWHFQWSTWTSFDYTNQTLCPYSSEK